MKILLINTLYYPNQVGGAERSVKLLAEGLVSKGHEVFVISLDRVTDTNIINGVKVFYLKYKNVYWQFGKKQAALKKLLWHVIDGHFFLFKSEFKEIIENVKPDVIHANNLSGISTSSLNFIKSSFDIPIVFTSRDYYLLCSKSTMFKDGKNCKAQCLSCKLLCRNKIRNVNKNVLGFVGISEFILKKHQDFKLNPSILKGVIYNPVEARAIRHKPKKKVSKVFGFIGSISKAKGIEDVFKMFLSEEFASFDWSIKVAGKADDEYLKYLKKKYFSNKIDYLGFTDSNKFYTLIDALIVPSKWHEPFGRVVVEAASKGLPVFVSNNGGLIELNEKLAIVKSFTKENIKKYLTYPDDFYLSTTDHMGNAFSNAKLTENYISFYNKTILQI